MAVLTQPIDAAWAALARARSARALHPDGHAHRAVLEVPGGAGTGVALFDEQATHAAVARLSRATGVPPPLPDALGLAVRVPDLHGPGRHQDILVTTSADVPGLHHLPLPAPRGPFGQAYSSLLPHRMNGRRVLLGALPDPDEGTFRLAICHVGGRFAPVATLRLGDRLPDDAAERLRFNPWNTGGGLAPGGGPVQRSRAAAYRGSQRARAARG